ncbi:MAG: 1,4-alpha-glucan branching protein GlgB [Gammaproteobacteria bacterium]
MQVFDHQPGHGPTVRSADGGGLLTSHDVYLLREGTHHRLYEKLGAHAATVDGSSGYRFAVWAPNASRVSVIGGFNGWEPQANPLAARADGCGVWEGFVPRVAEGAAYKYRVVSRDGERMDKADPFAFATEVPPHTASRTWNLDYQWGDGAWMRERGARNALDAPWSIYELHLGSWMRDGQRQLSYRELAVRLVDYVRQMGYTHVELMPVMEHPFYGSWGYQCTGFFAPTSRYGTPQDFMHLVDALHQAGIGVILDWVPSHYPADAHGLARFDGTYCYEHQDPRQGYHPEWNSCIFNYGRNEVRGFLASSALFWLAYYHADALRVDAVASMLYLDYGREDGEWIPNEHGGNENLAAITFLRQLNEAVYRDHPDVQTIAEESTAWPMVSRPTHLGGLGFGMKWNMGWMHDTLGYFKEDPVHRKYHHDRLTFGLWYAFNENFMLCLSHDEVVYGKGSMLRKMPGDDWQRFANLRLLLGLMYAHPGKKLNFMGAELAQWNEWSHEASLDWHLLAEPPHAGMQRWVQDLNHTYRELPALWQRDFQGEGFRWVDCHDVEQSTLSFLRFAADPADAVLVVCNMTPVPRHNHRVGVPTPGFWRERLNSDADLYGGSGQGNLGGAEAQPMSAHGFAQSLVLALPPLGVLYLTPEREGGP